MLIMISGPYRSGARTKEEMAANLLVLNQAAVEVFRLGHTPLVGVNAALPIIEAAGMESYDEIMMPICLALAERCDAVLRTGGASVGADEEVEKFVKVGKAVYYKVGDIPNSV